MKMTRNILRRLELKIHHAMTLDQIRKNGGSETTAKPEMAKPSEGESLLLKSQG